MELVNEVVLAKATVSAMVFISHRNTWRGITYSCNPPSLPPSLPPVCLQVDSYADDFKKEREDRAKAAGRIESLERQQSALEEERGKRKATVQQEAKI